MAWIRPYNPMNDLMFKFTFGDDDRKYITISFINAVLGREGDDAISEIEFRNVEFVPLSENEKATRFDVFCVTKRGERIDIEVQIANHLNMAQRTLYYWAQMYTMSLRHGQNYQDLTPSITINILKYAFLPGDAPHSVYGVYDIRTGHRLTDNLEIHLIELPKFKDKPIADMSRVERWFAFFANRMSDEEREELAMKDEAIKGAMDAAQLFLMDENRRLAYINREMAIRDYESDIAGYKAVGRAEGLSQGREGAAVNMLRDGMPWAQITRYTEVGAERLAELSKLM